MQGLCLQIKLNKHSSLLLYFQHILLLGNIFPKSGENASAPSEDPCSNILLIISPAAMKKQLPLSDCDTSGETVLHTKRSTVDF